MVTTQYVLVGIFVFGIIIIGAYFSSKIRGLWSTATGWFPTWKTIKWVIAILIITAIIWASMSMDAPQKVSTANPAVQAAVVAQKVITPTNPPQPVEIIDHGKGGVYALSPGEIGVIVTKAKNDNPMKFLIPEGYEVLWTPYGGRISLRLNEGPMLDRDPQQENVGGEDVLEALKEATGQNAVGMVQVLSLEDRPVSVGFLVRPCTLKPKQ